MAATSMQERRVYLKELGYEVADQGRLSVEMEDIFTALYYRGFRKWMGIPVTEYVKRAREWHIGRGTAGMDRATPMSLRRMEQYNAHIKSITTIVIQEDEEVEETPIAEPIEISEDELTDGTLESAEDTVLNIVVDMESDTFINAAMEDMAQKMNKELFTGSARVAHQANRAYVELGMTALMEVMGALGRAFDSNGVPLAACADELNEAGLCATQAMQFIVVLGTNVARKMRHEEAQESRVVVVLCSDILTAMRAAEQHGGEPMYGFRSITFESEEFDKLGWWVQSGTEWFRIEGFNRDRNSGVPMILLHQDNPLAPTGADHFWDNAENYSRTYEVKPSE